jgi:hypothetical protein
LSILRELSGNVEWQGILKAAKTMRPDLPKWSPEIPDSEKEWIYRSGMQDGFDLCFQIFSNQGVKNA